MKKVRASYLGRRTYEIIAEAGDGKTVRKTFKEPFFKDPKKYAERISTLVGELSAENVEVDEEDLSNRIMQAAAIIGRDFPNLLVK